MSTLSEPFETDKKQGKRADCKKIVLRDILSPRNVLSKKNL